jgi:hypothetical protein
MSCATQRPLWVASLNGGRTKSSVVWEQWVQCWPRRTEKTMKFVSTWTRLPESNRQQWYNRQHRNGLKLINRRCWKSVRSKHVFFFEYWQRVLRYKRNRIAGEPIWLQSVSWLNRSIRERCYSLCKHRPRVWFRQRFYEVLMWTRITKCWQNPSSYTGQTVAE